MLPVWREFGAIVEYNPSGIEKSKVSRLNAFISNGVLHITGLQPGQSLRIYNLAGQLVYNNVEKDENEHIPLNTRSIYIVVAGERSVKVAYF